MEQSTCSSESQSHNYGQDHSNELPVKVDIVDGADGLELHEIIFALQQTAKSLYDSDAFRAKYMERLVTKYQSIQRKRFLQFTEYFLSRFE